MKASLKGRLFKNIYLWVRKAIKKQHLAVHRNDIKCNNCNEWLSISGIRFSHNYKSHDWGYQVKCGQCGHVSYWNCDYAPFPVRCDENGNPTQ